MIVFFTNFTFCIWKYKLVSRIRIKHSVRIEQNIIKMYVWKRVTLKCEKEFFSQKGILFAKRTTLKYEKDFFLHKRAPYNQNQNILLVIHQ